MSYRRPILLGDGARCQVEGCADLACVEVVCQLNQRSIGIFCWSCSARKVAAVARWERREGWRHHGTEPPLRVVAGGGVETCPESPPSTGHLQLIAGGAGGQETP